MSPVVSYDVLINTDASVHRLVVLDFNSGTVIDQILVEIAELEVHGAVDSFGKGAAGAVQRCRWPVTVLSDIKGV